MCVTLAIVAVSERRIAVPELNLAALVRNRTISPQIGAVLEATGRERRSFLLVAIPRMAGKSTLMEAILDCVPEGTPLHRLTEHPQDIERVATEPSGGYLVVPEVSEAPVPGYIWGAPVRRVFATLDDGYALATALHAPGVTEAFAVLAQGNEVPDEQAARLELMVYVRSLGPDWRNPTRRAVAEVHEIDGVSGGVPDARLLFRWDEASDRFEAVEPPQRVGSTLDLAAIAARLEREAAAG